MLLERLNKIVSVNPANKQINQPTKPRSAKMGILYVNMIFQTKIQHRVIPAVTKSAGFTGIPARFAKSRLLHSKQ